MKQLASAILVLGLTVSPLSAEEDGGSLMERGAQQFLEGLLQEMEPAWREMQGFMEEMGPAMLELMEQVKDWSVYEPPKVLENGDIIIRRKPDPEQPPVTIEPAEPMPQVEL
jgi:hypothetical protein